MAATTDLPLLDRSPDLAEGVLDLTDRLIDLAGEWTVALDPHRRGERETWFSAELAEVHGHAALQLPGSVQAQGLGSAPDVSTPWVGAAVDHPFFSDERYAPYRESGNLKIPFMLQPERVFVGDAWYQRTIEIPEDTNPRDYLLELERVHWESTVWIDDARVGSQRSLTTAHRFVLRALEPGTHRLTIRVDNSMIVDVGTNAHSVTDHTQGGWNGIIGAITLAPVAPVRIEALTVHPNVAARSATVRFSILGETLNGIAGTVTLETRLLDAESLHAETPDAQPQLDPVASRPAPVVLNIDIEPERFRRGRQSSGNHFDAVIDLGDNARTWDEFDPAVYELTATLEVTTEAGQSRHQRTTTFGLREVSTSCTQIHVNGRPVFLRGALECCVFPLTGYPPTDRASWLRIITTCQAYGLNHLRFHSWCPPKAAFEAADATGMYLQVEGPIWANQGAAIGEGRDVDAYIYDESRRIIDEFGNHPSFLLMAHGNEPAGRDAEFLAGWVSHWKKLDSRRLYTTAGGWPSLAESDFDCIPEPRVQAWGEGLGSRINASAPETVTDYTDWVERIPRPIVTHEAGQWCVYPSLAEIEKYTGVMQPKNFEIARDFLAQSDLLDQADDFVHASGRLQVTAYKEEVEAALRTPGFGGIQLLGLSDFPGQGTAPVGVLDAFWEEKGYVDAAEFSRFFSSTVPLALLPRRTWSSTDTLEAEVRIAHFGAGPFDAAVTWRLVADDDSVVASGVLAPAAVVVGNEKSYGTIHAPLAGINRAQRVRLVIAVRNDSTSGGGSTFENDWELWVYPPVENSDFGIADGSGGDAVVVTRDLQEALDALAEGGTVLFAPPAETVHSPVEFGFSPVFWNTSWTNGQAPHTLGILCDPGHPLFTHFPTDAHTNWQWWEVLHTAKALDLTTLGAAARPLVQVIDSWFDARRLGLLLEARVGSGRLLLSTMDIVTELDDRAVARQLRLSAESYLAGAEFTPELELTPEQLRSLLSPPR